MGTLAVKTELDGDTSQVGPGAGLVAVAGVPVQDRGAILEQALTHHENAGTAPPEVEAPPPRHRAGAVLDPAHARALQALADDFAARLRGTAADIPAFLPVGRVVGAMAVVLEVADQLAQLLTNLRS